MSKVMKSMMISDIQREVGDCREVLVVDTSKLTAVATNQWRIAMQKKNIRILGVKNAVARKALSEIGLKGLDKALAGPSTLVWGGEDIVALSREISEWAAKAKEASIKGGAIGDSPLSPGDVESLSKSPGRKELLSQLAGLILSPGARLAAALLGPGGRVSGAIAAKADAEDAGESSVESSPEA